MPRNRADKESAEGEAKGGAKAAAGGCAICPLSAMMGAGTMLRSRAMDVFPEEFVEHAAGARREFLLAVRSLVDEALKAQDDYLEDYRDRRQEKARRRRGPEKVTVE